MCFSFLFHSSRLCKHAFAFGAFCPTCLVTAKFHLQARLSAGCAQRDPTSKARAGWGTSTEQHAVSGPQEIRMSSSREAGPKTPWVASSQVAPEGQRCPGLPLLHSPPRPSACPCSSHFPLLPPISRAFTICWTLKHFYKNHFNNLAV